MVAAVDDLDPDLARRMAIHLAGLSTALYEWADRAEMNRRAAMARHPTNLRPVR